MKKILITLLVVCSTSAFAGVKKPKKIEIPMKYSTHRIHSEITGELFDAKNHLKNQCETIANNAPKNYDGDYYTFEVDLISDDERTVFAWCTIFGPNESIPND
jgi:hypothetical protein